MEATFFPTDILEDMSFQTLTEHYMFQCAKGNFEKARQIIERDFNRKLHLEYVKMHANAMEYHAKMRECMEACMSEK